MYVDQYPSSLKPTSHCPIIKKKFLGPQSVVQSDEIFSDCFGQIILILLPDSQAGFLSDNRGKKILKFSFVPRASKVNFLLVLLPNNSSKIYCQINLH